MSDDEPDVLPDGTIASQHSGVRVFSITAPSFQELIDRIAVVLGEHLDAGDQLHVSYNAMQNGSSHDDGTRLLRNVAPHTTLFFEYSALIVLRSAG